MNSPYLSLILPLPPSVNSMFSNNSGGGKGRFPSKKYKQWRDTVVPPLEGEWPLWDSGNGDRKWQWHFTLYGLSSRSDLSNYAKAAEDMICTMTGLEDNNVRHLSMDWEPQHGAWGKCIEMKVEVMG